MACAPLLLFVLVGLAAPVLAPRDPLATDLAASLRPPSPSHWLGTDQLGRDQLSRMLYAARVSLLAAGSVLALSFVVGVTIGTVAGYAGGLIDRAVARLVDLTLSFPSMVVALAILGIGGGGLSNVVFALSLTGWPPYARIARARAAGARRSPHVDALNVLGARPRRILGRHLVPVAVGPSLVYASIDVGFVVLSVAFFSFLGLGIAPPTPEWGQMLQDARPFLRSALWLALPPGIAITGVVLSSNLLGEHLAARGQRPSTARARSRRGSAPATAPAVTAPAVEAVFEVTGLTLAFESTAGMRPVLDGVSYRVRSGETLAIVGESGSGKTVSVLAPLGLLGPHAVVGGSARLGGQELIGMGEAELRALRGRVAGVVFQDPRASLNPLRTVGAQVDEAVRNAGTARGRSAVRARTLDLLAMVGLPDPRRAATDHPHQLSGGMRQRAMLAIALAGEPDLLIADEPTTALDVTIQAQLLALLARLRDQLGMAVILISHDLAVVSEIADAVAVMYAGRIVEHGDRRTLLEHPDHPYTRGLLAAVPPVRPEPGARFATMPGVAARGPDELPGCPFAPRCAWRQPRCEYDRPSPELVGDGHRSACWVHPSRQPAHQDGG
ncbi:MAG: dipeptide/oligopeptide/nickel ABC transporter permease/ATP-binding protein [Egibacteraceae bacterium]